MSGTSVQQLMKKGKMELATFIKAECRGPRGAAYLNMLLDYLLDPMKPVEDTDRLDWCRYLIAGGMKFDAFAKAVRSYDNAVICGLVWTTDFVAYRCRTCGLSPCMSLCADCFQAGDHTGHDFNMFRSHAGGACDCGDESVMKAEGFCSHHGPGNVKKVEAPDDLTCVAGQMMPRLVERLMQLLCDQYSYGDMKYTVSAPDMEMFLDFLHQLSDMGAAMREILSSVLIDEILYTTIMNKMRTNERLKLSIADYEKALASLVPIDLPQEFSDIAELKQPLVHKTILDQMLLWVLKYDYPQRLVTLLLAMLPIDTYKESFATSFVKHYQYLSTALLHGTDHTRMCNCFVHISVQLFSPRNIASRLVNECYLLHILLSSLYNMISTVLTEDENNEHSSHRFVDCTHSAMKDHAYWPMASDLVNLLNQENIAQYFINEPRLLAFWLRIITTCQGMNRNERELFQHVEYEPEGYFASFGAESEICSSPMWALISHLQDELNPLQMSMHYPLHRYFAVFLSNAISRQGLTLEEVLPANQQDAFIHTLASHPFQIFVGVGEISSGLWVRNGQQIRGQVLTYNQCHFCNSTVDADLFLLQVLASRMEPDSFIMKVLMRYHVIDLLSVVRAQDGAEPPDLPKLLGHPPFLSKEQEYPMLEQALIFLCTLLNARTYSGGLDQELVRREMVSMLCMSDMTHSMLTDHIPDKSTHLDSTADVEETLKQVSVFKAPVFSAGSLQQGKYQPTASRILGLKELNCYLLWGWYLEIIKNILYIANIKYNLFVDMLTDKTGLPSNAVWMNEFDPVHVLLRSTYKRDYVSSLDRYSDHVKRKKLYKGTTSLWPPFRIPGPLHPDLEALNQLVHCRSMHGLIFSLLHKAVNDPSLPEAILYYTIHLLELSLTLPSVVEPMRCSPQWRDRLFFTWFDSTSISDNVRKIVDDVILWCPAPRDHDMAVQVYSETDDMDDLHLYLPPSTPSLPAAAASGSDHSVTTHSSLPFGFLSALSRRRNKKDARPSSAQRRAVGPGITQYTVWSSPGAGGVQACHVDTAHTDQRSAQAISGPTSSRGSTGREERVTESMISLLVKLHKRFSEAFGGERYRLPASRDPQEIIIAQFSASGLRMEGKRGGDEIVKARELPKKTRTFEALPGHSDGHLTENCGTIEPFKGAGLKADVPEGVDSRVGDGLFFIGKILDKICGLGVECERHVREVVDRVYSPAPQAATSPRPQKSGDGKSEVSGEKTDGAEENRRKAKARQEKLLKEFAAKQKQFMAKVVQPDFIGEEEEGSNSSFKAESSQFSNAPLVESTLYDCCICNQTTPSTLEQPVGVVCLLQSTSVLSQRRHVKESVPLPLSDDSSLEALTANCGRDFRTRLSLLRRLFIEDACLTSISLGWQGGVYATTCGHYLHLDCHQSYIQSLRAQSQLNTSIEVDRGEFSCPVCRQLSNCLLPQLPDVSQLSAAVTSQSADHDKHLAERLIDVFSSYSTTDNGEMMKKSMQSVMDMLIEVSYPQYRILRSFEDQPSLIYSFRSSILRTNLEIELTNHKSGSPCRPLISSFAPKKSCIASLYSVLSEYFKLVQPRPLNTLWVELTGLNSSLSTTQQSLSLCKYNEEVPLLLRDLCTVFIQLILSLPPSSDKSLYQSITRAVYNALVIQALVSISVRFSTDELSAWKALSMSQSRGGARGVQGLMAQIIAHLESSALYEIDTTETDLPAICGSIWSPLSVEACMIEHVLPYLRLSALLQHRLYNDQLPALDKPSREEEFEALAVYLGLAPQVSGGVGMGGCLRWVCDDVTALVRSWCISLSTVCASRSTAAEPTRVIISQNPSWHNPRLISLPKQYNDLFQLYRKKSCKSLQCRQRGSAPKYPGLCLVCAQLVCYKDQCCKEAGVGEAVRHSIECGGGVAILLLIKSSLITIIRGSRHTMWGSVYLDEHGEEDRELRRGRPLMLAEDRYTMLRMMWITHNFDHMCKMWSPHNNAL